MLTIHDLKGNVAPLIDNTEIELNQKLNEVDQIQLTTYDFPENHIGYQMITERCLLELPENKQLYRVTNRVETTTGKVKNTQLTALHVLHDLNDRYIKAPKSNQDDTTNVSITMSIEQLMQYLLKNTKFDYTIHDQFNSHTFHEQLEGRALDLFLNSCRQTFKYEFTVNNWHIDLFKKIGEPNSFVFIDNGNVSNISSTYDDSTITTHIQGESNFETKSNDENSTQNTITAEYTSPNAATYGIIDADYYSSSVAKTKEELIDELKAQIQDHPLLQLTLDYNEFQNNLINKINNIQVGNSGWIRDRFNIDISSRIIELTTYLQSSDGKEPTIVFGNITRDLAETISHLNNNERSLKNVKQSIAIDSSFISEYFSNSYWTKEDIQRYGRT